MTAELPAQLEGGGVGSRGTAEALRDALMGRRRMIATGWLFTGPAVVASVAYMDPGNFATNIQAGAKFGYQLLWVVLAANLIAMLFQGLSAKLGIVTDRNLAELSREHFPWPVAVAMWVASEIAAMATDLAEFLGGAIGLSLLFGISLLSGMAATAVITYALLMFGGSGFRKIELTIGVFVAIIGACYIIELFIVPIDWMAAATILATQVLASLVAVIKAATCVVCFESLGPPSIADREALLIAVGIVGATVMPHAVYLHSGLTQARAPVQSDADRRKVLRFSNREVCIALGVAGLVNMAMVMMAAGAFNTGHPEVAEIETAYHTLTPLLGGAAAMVFLISLIASGISSSVVGTMGGQIIMQGFFRRRIPIWVRRLVTMVPAFGVVAMGMGTTQALVVSQVILSLTLPVPMVALIILTSNKSVMGDFVNSSLTRVAAIIGASIVLLLNAVLLYKTFIGA